MNRTAVLILAACAAANLYGQELVNIQLRTREAREARQRQQIQQAIRGQQERQAKIEAEKRAQSGNPKEHPSSVFQAQLAAQLRYEAEHQRSRPTLTPTATPAQGRVRQKN